MEKSVLLDLVKNELKEHGIPEEKFITFNFKSHSNAKYYVTFALYEELARHIPAISDKHLMLLKKIYLLY